MEQQPEIQEKKEQKRPVSLKLTAIIAAAAVLAGAIAAAILFAPEKQESPAEETKPAVNWQPDKRWHGYGQILLQPTAVARFEITVEILDSESIQGSLRVSELDTVFHNSAFTGTGREENGQYIYIIQFERTAQFGKDGAAVSAAELRYDTGTDTFYFDDAYLVTMERTQIQEKKAQKFKKGVWGGYAEDVFNDSIFLPQTLFRFEVYEASEVYIRGRLTLSRDGQVYHDTEFEGNGYVKDGIVYYELLFETPQTNLYGKDHTVAHWVQYNIAEQYFNFDYPAYSGVLLKQ